MTRKRESTFVSPGYDDSLPRLQPLARMPDIEAQDVDAGKLFGRTPIHTHERRDPLTEAQAFMLKYAGLTLILLVLAIGLTIRLEWHYSIGVIAFAALSTGAYWILSFTESLFTGPGVERHRLSVGGRVLTRQIEADERVRLAQVALQSDQLALQREHIQHALEHHKQRAQMQVEAHTAPQSDANRLVGYTPTTFAINELEPPRFARAPTQTPHSDPAREALLSTVIELYERGDDGQWLHMDGDGYIHNSTSVPWGKRGGHTATERRQMVDLLRSSVLASFDENKRAWRINTRLYPDADSAIDALAMIATHAG